MVSGEVGMIILWIVIGFFGFITIVIGTLFFIFWRRRKLIWTNFLTDTGQWEKKGWYPNKIDKEFVYDGFPYKYDIKKCTRDMINRPIAHYYKGNPEQQKFDFAMCNKSVKIVESITTDDITTKDFLVMWKSKVLRDIFQDEELMNWLMMILVIIVVATIIICVMIATHNPACTLKNDNTTISIIAQGCKQAFVKV